MIEQKKYRCSQCNQFALLASTTYWQCQSCKSLFRCVDGIPCFYREQRLHQHDRKLRDGFYNGLMGLLYQFMMPLLVMPARPMKISWKHWLFYFFVWAVIFQAFAGLLNGEELFALPGLFRVLTLCVMALLFYRHTYLFYLLLLAVPVKLTLWKSSFVPEKSFVQIHNDLLKGLKKRDERLEILDISTGSCNSLIRHGWLDLHANLTGLDLSEVMLKKGVKQITALNRAMDFVFAEASDLPFASDFFDVTLNYSAINGYANIRQALVEMLRVTKKGGMILLFDENLYLQATSIERLYFKKVLAGHDTVDHCPLEFLPDGLRDLQMYQVYPFYFLLTAIKD